MKPLLAAIAALTAAQARGFDNVDPEAVPKAATAVIHELGIVVQRQDEEIAQLLTRVAELEVLNAVAPAPQPDTPAAPPEPGAESGTAPAAAAPADSPGS